MSQANQTLKEALALIERLPVAKQRQLAKRLLEKSSPDERALVVYLKHLPPAKQNRFTELMDKNTEGELTKTERVELRQLNHTANRLMLENSRALTQALHPELFDKAGRLLKRRVQASKGAAADAQIATPRLAKRELP